MPSSLRGLFANLALIVASLVLVLLAGELVFFRFVLLPSDVPRDVMVDEVIRHAPNQTGVWRVMDEIAAPYAINSQGWNSGTGDYRVERTPGVARIAVIGDSMVEALQVAASASLAEQLGRRLGPAAEVYRFAIAGAPLSQYLWMFEREVARYAPDLTVVVLIHNDFDESFGFERGRYTSSFLKLKIANGRVSGEIPPTFYDPPWWDGLRFSATFRYFRYRQRLDRYTFLPARASEFIANTEALANARQAVVAATDHVLARLALAAGQNGTKPLLLIDGDRNAIYPGGAGSEVLALSALAAVTAARHGIAIIDLHPRFAADWAAHRRRFDFLNDYHWNERGHEVAAATIAEFVGRGPRQP